MLTIYWTGLVITLVLAATFDPTNQGRNYLYRGLVALLLGITWVATVIPILIGYGGTRLMEYILNKWPDNFG